MKRNCFIILLLICTFVPMRMLAQDITLITTGEGATKDDAIKAALVSAVEQAYGVYVSGDTHILNDELIRDEIVQIKRGNIKRYNILNEITKSRNKVNVTIEVTVSTDQLLKFAQSKGATCELAGRTFGANLDLYKLHASNGASAMKQLYNMLGWIATKMFDYRLNLGEPIVYKSDVYIPVAVDCVLNDNYYTFIDLYRSTYNSVTNSIASIPIKGDSGDKNLLTIEQYHSYIQQLPKVWAMGFLLRDNLDDFVIPQLDALYLKMPDNAFWPSAGVTKYKIDTRYNGQSYIYGLPSHSYIIYNQDFVFLANDLKNKHSLRIQKLDYDPLCSLNDGERGGNVLRDYVRGVEKDFSRSTTGINYADEAYSLRDFDSRMVVWDNGKRKVNTYNWIDDAANIAGKPLCTVNFFICYKTDYITGVTDIKVQSLLQEE